MPTRPSPRAASAAPGVRSPATVIVRFPSADGGAQPHPSKSMDVRSLRRKRITIILLTVALLTLAVGGVYVVQKKQSKARIAAQRAAGMAAYEAGDFPLAVEQLKPYVEANVFDAEAWYAYALANANTPLDDQSHIGQALRALRHVVYTLKSDNLDARHDLLELEVLVQQNERALALAESILQDHPGDEQALRMRVLTLARLGRNAEAWQLAQELLAQRPQDLEIQLAVIQLRYELNHPAAEIVADARKLVEDNPDDPRYELLLGTALGLGGQEEEGVAHLEAASQRPMPADVPLIAVVRLLDQTTLFNASLRVLMEQVTDQSEPLLYVEKVSRCFEAGLLEDVRQMLAEKDLTDPATDIQIAVVGAMTSIHFGDLERAGKIAAALRARPHDNQAAAWADVLDHLAKSGLVADADAVKLLREAVTRAPGSAYLHTLLGDALADGDEMAQAAEAWRKAAALRGVWDAPLRQLARYHLATGQPQQAAQFAEAAYLRRPNNPDNAMVLVQVQAVSIKPGDVASLDELLMHLDEIDAALGTKDRTMLLRVETLANLGEVGMMQSVLERVARERPELPDAVLARLIEMSRTYELETTDSLVALRDHSADPQAALNEALAILEDGRKDEAIAYVQEHRVAGNLAWELAHARILDAAADAGAVAAWKALTEKHPEDARIQIAALRGQALAHDQPAADAIIARLRRLGGENGAVWRVEQARWMLRGDGNVEAALELLRTALTKDPAEIDARVLSAMAYQRTGRLPLAVREMQTAISQRPDALSLRLELADLFQQMRSYELSAEQLNTVALNPAASPALLRRAAMMMAQQGADLRAIALLEEVMNRSADTGAVDNLLLASLYRRNGMMEKAEDACERLMADPTPGGVLFVAGFYAMIDRGDEARRVLETLDAIDAPEDEKADTRASYFSRFGLPEEALPHYRKAVEVAPDNREHWRKLVSFELTIGEVNAALDDARRAVAALNDMSSLKLLADHAAQVKRFATVDRWRPLVISIVSEPEGADVAVRALRALDTAPDDPASQAAALRELVDAQRSHLPLQLSQVRCWLDAGKTHEAAELATRAMYGHPMSVDAAWMASEALSAEQRWPEALIAASQWRQRSAGQSMNADLIIAEAKLRMNDVAAAMREVQPHLDAALAEPRHYPAVIFSYARILVADGKPREARQVLRPMLDIDSSWRLLWGRLGSLLIQDHAEAAAWLTELEPHIPANSADEQGHMAQSWWSLFLRTQNTAHREAALAWVNRAIERDQTLADAWLLKGIISEITGELDEAEHAYRQTLALGTSQPAAANNLAMVILRRGGDTEEAIKLARDAVTAEPGSPDYLDTLAQVYAKSGQYDPAIDAMRRAIDVDPGRATWQWNLLDLYEAAGMEEDAARQRDKLRLQYPLGRPEESANAM